MGNIQEKKSGKEAWTELKDGFKVAVKDKKRWITCLIELAIVAVLIVADLLTKKYVYGYCVQNGKVDIIKGVISFTAVQNSGAGFGIFANHTTALTVVSVICAIILFVFIFYSYPRRNLWLRSALILILAGAIGNIIDRIALGYVRDYIYFELINFAVFNFADSCLTVGTIVLIIYMLVFYSKEEKEKEEKRKIEMMLATPSKNDKQAEIKPEETLEEVKPDAEKIDDTQE